MRADGADAQGVLLRQHAHALGTQGDGLVREGDLDDAVHGLHQRVAGLEQVALKIVVDVAAGAADGDHGVVDAVAGQALQQIHDELALIPDVHEHAVVADDVAGDAQPQEVGVQSLKLGGDHADIGAPLRDLHLVDLLHGQRVGKGVGVRADAAHTLHQHQRLDRVAFRGELFDAAVVVADEHLGVLDDLSVGVELGVNRLLQGGMVRSDGKDVAHASGASSLFSRRSSLKGVTMIWPLPCVSSMSSGRNRRLETSSPSKVTPKSSFISRSGHWAATS